MPCRFASSGTVATSRSASRAILALNVASNFLRDLVISVLHRLRQSRTLHTLTFGPISGVHFSTLSRSSPYFPVVSQRRPYISENEDWFQPESTKVNLRAGCSIGSTPPSFDGGSAF